MSVVFVSSFFKGERPFECDVCHARFTLKHSMMRHRRKHEGSGAIDGADMQSDSDEENNLTAGPGNRFNS